MNITAILVCAVWAMVSGYVWYSPILFSKPWMKLAKISEKELELSSRQMGKMYGITIALNLAAAYILSTFFMGKAPLVDNLLLMTLFWLTFTFIPTVITNLFNRKPFALSLINTGYMYVAFMGFATILTFLGN